MPDFPLVPGGIIECRVYATFQGSVIMNVYHYVISASTPSTPNGDAALNAWGAVFLSRLYGAGGVIPLQTSANMSYDYAEFQAVSPDRYYYVSRGMGYNGTRATAPDMPSDTQLACTYRNSTTGRGRAGRKSFTGFQTDQFTGTSWNSTLLTPWTANVLPRLAASVVSVGPPAITADPVIWSPGVSIEVSNVIQVYANTQVRVMRRRQIGIGA